MDTKYLPLLVSGVCLVLGITLVTVGLTFYFEALKIYCFFNWLSDLIIGTPLGVILEKIGIEIVISGAVISLMSSAYIIYFTGLWRR